MRKGGVGRVPSAGTCQGSSNIYPFGSSKSPPPCPFLGLFDLGLFDEPGLDLLPEAIGVAFDVDGGGVVQDPVQDGRGDHRVAERGCGSSSSSIAVSSAISAAAPSGP